MNDDDGAKKIRWSKDEKVWITGRGEKEARNSLLDMKIEKELVQVVNIDLHLMLIILQYS